MSRTDGPTGTGGADPAAQSEPTPAPSPSMAGVAAKGAAWSALGLGGNQAIQMIAVIILARLLGPENFGIVAQATIIMAFLTWFVDQGIGSALTQKKDLGHYDVGSAFALTVTTGLVVAGGFALSAPLIAAFFDSPALNEIVPVLGLTLLIQGLSVVPLALLKREMRFRALAAVDLTAVVFGGAVGIVAALAGADYWALVAQNVTIAAVALLLVVLTARPLIASRRLLAVSQSSLRELLRFGVNVTGFQLLSNIRRYADNFLVAKFLGATQLALYALSYRTMMVPVTVLGRVVNRVSFPLYSKLQDESERVRRNFLATTRAVALVAWPLLGFVAVLAPTAVPWVFGSAWEDAALPMQALAAAALISCVMYQVGPVLMALGRADWQLHWGIFAVIIGIPAFVVAAQFGIVEMALAVVVAELITAPFALIRVRRLIGLNVRELLASLLPALGALVALVAIGALTVAAADGLAMPPPALIGVTLVTGAAAYLATLKALWPDELAHLTYIFTLMRRRG